MKSSKEIRIRQLDFLAMQFNLLGYYMKNEFDAFDTDICDEIYPEIKALRDKIIYKLRIEKSNA